MTSLSDLDLSVDAVTVSVLDTDILPARDRASAWLAATVTATAPSTVELAEPEHFSGRFDWWSMGPVDVLRHRTNSGQVLRRTEKQVRIGAAATISLAIHSAGVGRHEQFGVQRILATGDMACIDLSAPYEYSFARHGAARAIQISHESLDLPESVIKRGIARSVSSPLHTLVARHVADLTSGPGAASDVAEDRARVGQATVDLVRALLLSTPDS